MVFASLTFLYIFLPLNLILYYIHKDNFYRNFLLTLFSLFFYAWGEPVWIILLLISASFDYANGLFIQKHHGTKLAKIGLAASVVVNIGLLVTFKYSSFIYDNINHLFHSSLRPPNYSLPIGISFYTFQTLSYVIDVYKGEVKAQRSYMNFLMFVSLYHQLVAGPIVRYQTIANEIDGRKENIADISSGINRFCIGLFKKVCIANVAGELVMRYMDGNLAGVAVGESWFAILMYSIQIYFDFSGYSDMAIGLGKMFGFHYLENFDYPYISRSATEFWRRWHISLGSFFRDYVYIPLGGNRNHQYFNLFIVWFLTGLWHGASWNFIVWGLYFGFLIAIEKLFLHKVFERLPKIVGHVYLLFMVVVGWALFYFTDFNRLLQYLKIMFFQSGHPLWSFGLTFVLKENLYWMILSFVLCTPVYLWLQRIFVQRTNQISEGGQGVFSSLFRTQSLVWTIGLIVFNFSLIFMATSMLIGKSYNPFIYFRF
ncbi:MAG: rane bound O-acyl transferase family protein [Bacteroidota bacterium]|nr:rane bound O-acyl transferase family protein [Bacteroidota bacterium]